MSLFYDAERRTHGFVVRVDGRQIRRRGFKLKRDARNAECAFLNSGETAIDSTTKLGPYLTETWLPALESRNLKPATLDTYRRLVRKHLVPHLGRVQLGRLSAAHIETMMGALDVAPKSIRNIVGVLSKALTDAQRWGLVTANVVRAVEQPRRSPVTPRAWNANELHRFTVAAADDRLAIVWAFIAETGCRRGEALGVRWRNIDLDTGRATLIETRTIVGGSVVEGTTKSSSGARTVLIGPDLIDALRVWRRAQNEDLMALGVRNRDGFVFTDEEGRPYWPQRITARFRQITDDCDLPRIGVHGLRHTQASLLIGAGISPKLVAARLGHSDPGFTLRQYSHVLAGADAEAVAVLTELRRRAVEKCDHGVTREPVSGA